MPWKPRLTNESDDPNLNHADGPPAGEVPFVEVREPMSAPIGADGSTTFVPNDDVIKGMREGRLLSEQELSSLLEQSHAGALKSSRRVEQLARQRLGLGHVSKALELADRATPETSSTRLLANVCRCCAGERATAHLNLFDWMKDPSCPLDARVLLALLELQRGRESAAIKALRQNVRQLHDQNSIRLLILIHLKNDRLDEAKAWGQRLRETATTFAHQDGLDMWLDSLGLKDEQANNTIPTALIDTLTLELLASESVIPSLVAAMERAPSIPQTWLLIRAIENAIDKFELREQAFECLARLALIAEDRNRARDWATRGLEENPYSAPLALVLAQVEEDARGKADSADDADWETGSETLRLIRAAAEAQPDWPDLQQALRRLEAA